MDVLVTGATGVLGHRLVERLADRGHGVVGLVRDEAGAALVEDCGGVPQRGDVLDPDSLERAAADVDTIVHAATSIPTDRKPSEEQWRRNDRVRHEGARNLVAVTGGEIDRFLFPSVVWVARRPDGSPFDETAPRNPDRTTRSAAAVEEYLETAAERHGFAATVLRCGFFYAPDGATTRTFGEGLLAGRAPVVGRGLLGRRDAELSLVHAIDAARAFVAAIDAGVTGLYHVVDDRPVTLADYLTAFADELDAPRPRRVPAWLARFALGSEMTTVLTSPMPTTNERFRDATGWAPRYPTHSAGLTRVVETWENEGVVRRTDDGYEWDGPSVDVR